MDENLETKDQAQVDSPEKTEEKEETSSRPKVIRKDQAPKEQSEKGEEVAEKPKTYKTPDGRELTPDQIYEEYNKLHPEFTRRSQKLAEYERRATEEKERNSKEIDESLSKNKLLEDLDPNVKLVITELAKQVAGETIEDRLSRERSERERAERQSKFDKRLEELEKKYPDFNRLEVLKKMQDPDNEIYDPEVLYQRLHWDTYLDSEVKKAMKQKAGGVTTESTSTQAPRKPSESQNPSSWSEASKRALSR